MSFDLRPVPAAALARHERLSLLGGIGAVAAAAWLLLLPGVSPLGHAHGHGAGVWAYLLSVGAWWIMMVGMMLPPVVPWLLLMGSGAPRGGAGRGSSAPVVLFATGYFAVWLGYSAVAAGVQVALQRGALLGMDLTLGPRAGGAVLVAAGLFQLSPLKGACLAHCRNPLGYLLRRWRDGPAGALRMGADHGLFCVGCCWALMALAFAVGVMNLLWMAALTVVLCVEKIAPRGAQLGRALGVGLVGWGAWRLLVP